MKGFPRLTKKEILKRHGKKPQDNSVHTIIETKGIKKDTFNKLIEESTKQKPFDKKKKTS
jgi:hypothetical protein